MSPLDHYLSEYFLDEPQFAKACGLSREELARLITARLIPSPSYVVSIASILSSPVMGDLEAPGSTPGLYFRPEYVAWVRRAQTALAEVGPEAAHTLLKADFASNLLASLNELNATTWRLFDSFNEDGSILPAGLQVRMDEVWEHFLNGTYGLCVADPASEAAIARKEVLQEKLMNLSGKGTRTHFQNAEAQGLLALMNAYAEASMPFSPVDYPLSSRKRLVDDLRPRVLASMEPIPGSGRSLP